MLLRGKNFLNTHTEYIYICYFYYSFFFIEVHTVKVWGNDVTSVRYFISTEIYSNYSVYIPAPIKI